MIKMLDGSRMSELARLWRGAEPETFAAELNVPCLLISESWDEGGSNFETTCHNLSLLSRPVELVVVPVAKRAGANFFASMITIGRAPNNDVVIPHPAVSKFHAYLSEESGGYRVCDGGSANGTVVDGVSLGANQSAPLCSGSEIVLGGGVRARFLDPADLFEFLQEMPCAA